jgi:hypothetical protein
MEVEDDVGSFQGGVSGREHPGLKRIARIEQAGEILEDVLRVCLGPEADDGEPGGLGLGADDRQVLADQGVEEARLSDVRYAGERDVAREGHGVASYQLSVIG